MEYLNMRKREELEAPNYTLLVIKSNTEEPALHVTSLSIIWKPIEELNFSFRGHPKYNSETAKDWLKF